MKNNFEWNKNEKKEGVIKKVLPVIEMKFKKLKNILFKYQKVLFVILGILVVSVIIYIGIVIFRFKSRDRTPDKNIHVEESSVENNKSSRIEQKEGSGISDINPPLIRESTLDGGIKNNITPSFTVSNPVINDAGNGYVWYSYNIRLNEAASIKYGSGFEYVLGPGNCTDRAFFSSDSDLLSGSLDNPVLGDNTIIVRVENIFLNSSTKESTYEIKDKNGNVISSGDVLIPDCKSAIESRENNGSMKVDGPVITDSNEKVGFSTVKYHFIPDEDAIKILEDGFSYKIYDDGCKDWLSEDPFNKTYEEGKVGYIGSTFDLDNDAFDTNNSLKKSVYEMFDSKGKLLFRGFVDVPNCR